MDVRGCYWPVSEVVNLQVFPHFSPSEATIAVMKNCSYSRKVMTYKLPICRFNLQYLCRRAILHLVSYREINKLPLPANIVNFLLAKPGYTHTGISEHYSSWTWILLLLLRWCFCCVKAINSVFYLVCLSPVHVPWWYVVKELVGWTKWNWFCVW